MPRITFVKSAQQRYRMTPDLDPLSGEQRISPVMQKDGVTPKKTKTGRPIMRRVTIKDLSDPLPPLSCDFPGCQIDEGRILVGSSYKHITPRSGPYGGKQRNRHAEHPNWNVWEYSSSRSAQVARVQADMHSMIDGYEFSAESDFDDLRSQLVETASEQRDEQEEALNNMPEALQDGSQAQERFEALEAWVDAIENADEPSADFDEECGECDGTGEVDNPDYDEDDEDSDEEERVECDACDGTGKVEGPSEEWLDEARDNLRAVTDEVDL